VNYSRLQEKEGKKRYLRFRDSGDSKKGAFMERKEVSEEELLVLLNAELSKHNDMNKVSFVSIERIAEPDSTGCNWSKAIVRGGGVPHYLAAPVTGGIVSEARKKYNVK